MQTRLNCLERDGRHALSGAGGTTIVQQWTGGTDFAIRLWELPE